MKKNYCVYVDASMMVALDPQQKRHRFGSIMVRSPRSIHRMTLEIHDGTINDFEYGAIQFALRKYANKKNLIVYSDSKHAVQRINDSRVMWVPRENNKAGWVFEEEQLKNKGNYGILSVSDVVPDG